MKAFIPASSLVGDGGAFEDTAKKFFKNSVMSMWQDFDSSRQLLALRFCKVCTGNTYFQYS